MRMPEEIGGRPVVLWTLTGSRSYGLQTEGSDEDHIALVAPTFEDLYGGTMFSRQSITLSEDVLAYDVRRLPELLWKSNPSFLEMLFSPEIRIPETPAADAMRWVVSERDPIARMNLPKLWSATLGIYEGKMQRLERGTESTQILVERYGYDTKQAMHSIRSLMVLRRFADSGFSDFGRAIRPDPDEREYLLSIRSGRYTLEEFRREADRTMECTLPLRGMYCSAEPDAALRDELSGRVRDAVRACLHIPRWSVHPGGDEEHLLLVPGQGQDLHLPGRVGGDVAALGQLGHPPIDLLVGEAGDIHYR